MTSWIDQIAAERAVGQPIDETFLSKWDSRQKAHRQCQLPKWAYSEDFTGAGTAGFNDLGSSTEIFIPPWAGKLILRDWLGLSFLYSDPLLGVVGGWVTLRYRIGASTDYSTEAEARAGCKVRTSPPLFEPFCDGICNNCDGDENSSGASYIKQCEFDVPEAMLGTVQTLQPEGMKNSTDVTLFRYNIPTSKPRWYFTEVA